MHDLNPLCVQHGVTPSALIIPHLPLKLIENYLHFMYYAGYFDKINGYYVYIKVS